MSKDYQTCLECEEYNHEKHYCPLFCDVIREAVKDIRKDSIPIEWIKNYTEENRLYQSDDFDLYIGDMIADWTERKEE